jgi:hypothetical protein
MSWNKLVENLRRLIVARVEERDLDLNTVLSIVQSAEMRNVMVDATEEYQRLCATDIVKKLAHVAEQKRCAWMRSELASAADYCGNALQAWQWHEDEAQRKLALGECLCCAAVAAHTEARYERCPECGKTQPEPNPDDAPHPPNDLESEAS